MGSLISVIIPVYKVERYLPRCIDSILSQTYKNIELLLIDDGSPDLSGSICDEYATIDKRVRVLHKENGGVSSARNLGLQEAKGDYIGFIDADDYISPEMYQKLVELIEKYDADISVVGFANESSDGTFQRYCETEGEILLSQHEQMECLLTNKYYSCSCCDKLFKKELVTDVRFDVTKKHNEDLLFLYEVMKHSRKAVFISEPYYYYRTTDGSASQSAFSDATMDIVYISEYILGDIQKNMPELYSLERREFMRNNITCAKLAVSSEYDNQGNLKRIQSNIRQNIIWYLFSSASWGYKFNALLLSISWKLFKKYGR